MSQFAPFARKNWIWFAAILSGALWLGVHQDISWETWGGDEAEYADVARRLARGEGFTTSLIYPAEIEWGVDRDHPSLVRPPLWPLILAAGFSLLGPNPVAIQLLLLCQYMTCVVLAGLLGQRLMGLWGGVVAAIAVVASPDMLALSFIGMTETLYTAWVLLAFLLLAQGARPIWIGLVCGLLYLTRYNGIVLLPFVLVFLATGENRIRRPAECMLGFVLVAMPWWIRNWMVTGDPVFTYYRWAIYFSPTIRSYTTTLMHMIDPSPLAPMAMDPVEKVKLLLPTLFLNWPLAAANFTACLGLLIACLKRNRLAICFAGLAIATTVGMSLALPRGRYFAPLFPTLVVLGIAGWWSLRTQFKWIGVAAVLMTPWLPAVIQPAQDLAVFRYVMLETGRGESFHTPWASCITDAGPHPLVVAEDASRVVWETDATTIWLPATGEDFWTIVDDYPVEFVYLTTRQDILADPFLAHFEPREDCSPGLYQRAGDQKKRGSGSPPGEPSLSGVL